MKNAHPIVTGFEIGANDEPNGHGTIVCKWARLNKALEGQENKVEAKKLKAILSLFNQAVGDAIANFLAIESILRDLDMTVKDLHEIYQENPSRMYKAVVADRNKFKPIWDESRLMQPANLQEIIDKQVASVEEGKAFVRPSGTEDILRLYCEARTVEETKKLGSDILNAIETKFKNI